ncbi:hypothetical protein MJ1_0640 [Nanobdella aerobiophila]|uniref:Uncharacterized protein n=1 Tax=Nanobdella aerobiophila TaxID=2586965 RepID=A0A915SYG3_9ARCH|nr:hypothetical protein [Nanobdella aerobiophila]BBL45785.1 hypothetical protein MJ1_0640 [Nanobdella aerobiophila]
MKGVSLWVEFLIYTSFAIAILSFVLYYVHLSIANNQSEINLRYTVSLLSNLNYEIYQIGSCYSCTYEFQEQIPSNLIINIYPGYINAIYYSNINYSIYVPSYINLNVTNISINDFLYNFSINTLPFNISGNEYSISGNNICLLLNKTVYGFFIDRC